MLVRDVLNEEMNVEVTTSFQEWQRETLLSGLLPVIGIAGSTGKSTVVRLLDRIFRDAGLRTATWTNLGIEIRGRRQRAELSGWALALSRLAEGNLDVVIQELDWSTINAVGLPPASYPVIALTNLRGFPDASWSNAALETAMHAAFDASLAASPDGFLVVNGDDYSLVDATQTTMATPVVVAMSKDSPALNRQHRTNHPSAWTEDGVAMLSDGTHPRQLALLRHVPVTMGGHINFQASNMLIAAALASVVGIGDAEIRASLSGFRCDPDVLPGTMNVWDEGPVTTVVTTLRPSWQTRLILRAINPGAHRRQITLLGDLSPLEERDVEELGRLLGRGHGAIVLYGPEDESKLNVFRHGLTANEFPPLVIHLPTERKAINRALRTARKEDVVLMMPTGDPGPSIRAASRFGVVELLSDD